MNATVLGIVAKPKRSHHKKKPTNGATQALKPRLPNLDPNDPRVWEETAKAFQEGNAKLARAIDVLREGLQTISVAEMDNHTKMPVSAAQLRAMAVETLNAAAALAGQNWLTPRNQVVRTRAGGAEGPNARRNVGNDGEDYD